MQDVVQHYNIVRAVGTGHSWNSALFCPGDKKGQTSVGLVTTELDSLSPLWQFNGTFDTSSPDFPIRLDADTMVVHAAAGLSLRLLLEFLAQAREGGCARGCILASFPGLIDQTVGGAVSTGTHGSSLAHGSLSQQECSCW